MKTTTARSRALMESEGYYVELVERWDHFSRRRHDLFGFTDLFCIHRETGDIRLVQSTSHSNVSSRINKITNHENLPLVRKAGMAIEVHGWKKNSKGRWSARREDIS